MKGEGGGGALKHFFFLFPSVIISEAPMFPAAIRLVLREAGQPLGTREYRVSADTGGYSAAPRCLLARLVCTGLEEPRWLILALLVSTKARLWA